MNREIKFRAFDKKSKKMIYSREPNTSFDFYNVDIRIKTHTEAEDINDLLLNSFKGCPKELMQFTGLKDKNKKDIYEGDIIASYGKGLEEDEIFTIVFAEYSFMAESLSRRTGYALRLINSCKLIGNIYENPELLKEEK